MISASFNRALGVHFRVVGALLLREIRTRFGKSQVGYLWALIEPTVFVATFVAIFKLAHRAKVSGQSIEAFFMCGIILWLLFFNTQSKITVGFSANRNLLAYPQVTAYDIFVSRVILEWSTYLVIFIILTFVLILFNINIDISSFLLIIYAFVVTVILGAGFGLIFCAMRYYIHSIDKFSSPVLRLVYFGSGPFYSVTSVPNPLRDILLLNPLVHLLEICRLGYFRSYHDTLVNYTYPLYFALITLFFGLIADRLTRSKLAAG